MYHYDFCDFPSVRKMSQSKSRVDQQCKLLVVSALSIALWLSWGKLYSLAIFIFLIVLLISVEEIKRVFENILKSYFKFFILYAITFGPALAFYGLSGYIPEISKTLQNLILVLWGIILGTALWILIIKDKREKLYALLRANFGILAPWAYPFNFLLISIFFFSSLTYTLYISGFVSFESTYGQEITTSTINDYYLWQFLNSIPVFKITETLLWSNPLTYSGGWAGPLLLIFKIIVISPVIGAFISYWRYIQEPEKIESPTNGISANSKKDEVTSQDSAT